MCSEHPRKWLSWLLLAQWWYNTTYHTSLKCSPFQALFGFDPPYQNFYQLKLTKVPAVDDFIRERTNVMSTLRDNLLQAQNRMKVYADQRRTEITFQVGDYVYLKLQPYKQSTLAHRSSFKLALRYYGPYEVLANVGLVDYKLKLPVHAQIHDVFHVSLLKKKLGNHTVIAPSLPPVNADGRPKLRGVNRSELLGTRLEFDPKI